VTDLRATTAVRASAEMVYDRISDVTRMGEWSPENQGGEWLDGATGAAVGARFRSRNKRKGVVDNHGGGHPGRQGQGVRLCELGASRDTASSLPVP